MGLRGNAIVGASLLAASVWAWSAAGSWENLWETPAQQTARLLAAGRYAEAAERTSDPLARGEALFRDGQFKDAAQAYTPLDTAVGAFNRGTALVMGGRYEEAVAAYDRALELRPGWEPPQINREIARVRAERTKAEGGLGTGGKLGADEVVIGEPGENTPGEAEEVEVGGGEPMSDEELRALWLRRVETKASEFLRAKFQYQQATREAGK